MASALDMMKRARRRSKDQDENTSERFKEILGIVKKHDLREGLTPEKAVELRQDLGTTFVKLGQIASSHPDVLPPEYCEALGALRTQARPLDFADVRAQVEGELGRPLDELFSAFHEVPLGSASIAQVHRAQLPDGTEVAYLVAGNYMAQMMEDGFYHADPHAGNVLLPEGGGIEWIDFGMMGTMTASQRDALEELILAMVKGDAYELKRAVLKVATPTGPVAHGELLGMCEAMTAQFIDVDLESFDTAALMSALMNSLKDAEFDIDPFLVNLGRGFVTLEGTIHLISPRLNIMQVLVDYLQSTFDPSRIQQKARRTMGRAIESAEAMAGLPAKAFETLDMIQKGHAKIGMELSSNEKFSRDLRAAAGLLAARARGDGAHHRRVHRGVVVYGAANRRRVRFQRGGPCHRHRARSLHHRENAPVPEVSRQRALTYQFRLKLPWSATGCVADKRRS